MTKLLVASAIGLLAAVAILGVAGTGTSLAHVHPFIGADECAVGDGAGNEADPANDENPGEGDNGQDFIPGLVPRDNPGGADDVVDFTAPNPGVEPSTENCAAP